MSSKFFFGGMLLGLAGTVHAQAIDLPDLPECTELTPGAVSLDTTPVTLGLRVVLDGVGMGQAVAAVNEARTSYAPLDISLAVSYDFAHFSNDTGLGMIEEVKQFYGGTRPAGTHLVFVLTSKNLTDGSVVGDALAGQADCIGGVAYPANAFAVGEYDVQAGGRTLAHEVGHLLGGQHQYANCAEALVQGGDNLCTVMFNDVGFASLPFSTLNGLLVRGHAQLAAESAPRGDDGTGGSASAKSGGGSMPALSLLLLLFGSALRRRPRSAG